VWGSWVGRWSVEAPSWLLYVGGGRLALGSWAGLACSVWLVFWVGAVVIHLWLSWCWGNTTGSGRYDPLAELVLGGWLAWCVLSVAGLVLRFRSGSGGCAIPCGCVAVGDPLLSLVLLAVVGLVWGRCCLVGVRLVLGSGSRRAPLVCGLLAGLGGAWCFSLGGWEGEIPLAACGLVKNPLVWVWGGASPWFWLGFRVSTSWWVVSVVGSGGEIHVVCLGCVCGFFLGVLIPLLGFRWFGGGGCCGSPVGACHCGFL